MTNSNEKKAILTLVPNRDIQQLVLAGMCACGPQAEGMAFAAPAVDVLSLWAGRLVQRALLVSGNRCRVEPSQLRLRRTWENAITATDQQGLLPGDIQSLAREAMEADRLCENWLIPAGFEPGQYWNDEGFCRWRERVHASLDAHGWTDSAGALCELADLLESGHKLQIVLPECIELRGFVEKTPLEQRVLAALQSRGVAVTDGGQSPPSKAQVSCETLADVEKEIWAAAAWAQEKLDAGAETVAVAVNDFEALRPRLERAFRHTFEPLGVLEHASSNSPRYHLHGGTALSREPLVQAAFDLLALSMAGMQRPQSFALISRWMLSSAWHGADLEAAQRALLELNMRGQNRYQPTLAFTADLARQFDCPMLLELTGRIPGPDVADTSSRRFFQWLSHWGWPGPLARGQRPSQVVERFRNALEELEFAGETTDENALGDLRQLCQQRQLGSAGGVLCPVQVLAVENCAGRRFDELRVINLHGDNWPAPVRLNRLLPFSLSKALPRSDMQRQLKHFQALQEGLLHSAPRVSFSRPEMVDGVRTSISPLVNALGVGETQGDGRSGRLATRVWPNAGDPLMLGGRDELLPIAREQGPHLGETTELKRVVSVLNLQSACPWAAFLVHRLDAQFPAQPEPFADAAFTGSLVHTALERLYRPFLDTEQLPGIKDVPAAVGAALESPKVRARLVPAAIAAERRRIEALLFEWLACEQSLTLGQPRILEQSREATLGGFTFQVRLDRLDAVPGGSLVLDYKTGSLPKMSWGDKRPGELQLPLYAVLAQGDPEPALGIGLLSLRGGEMKQLIWSGSADIKGKPVKLAGSARDIPFADWNAALNSWSSSFTGLLEEYRSGVNEFIVYRPEALRWTGLDILLRLESDPDEENQQDVSNVA